MRAHGVTTRTISHPGDGSDELLKPETPQVSPAFPSCVLIPLSSLFAKPDSYDVSLCKKA